MNLFEQNNVCMNQLPPIANFGIYLNLDIRSATAVDVDLVWQLHQQLSSDSIYSRYHSLRMPSRTEIARMCELSKKNGRSFIASIPGKAEIVGMAYYIVQPANPDTAEPALLVADAFQGQGIGRRLMQVLGETAVSQGIRFFDANVLPTNSSMIHLLSCSGRLIENRLSYGVSEMRVQL